MSEICEDCKDCPFCNTEKCCGVPHSDCCPPPFGHPHFHHFPHFEFEHYQHTQPLLFDECWTIPEEIALIQAKLQFLLEHKHLFHCDFCSWAKEVEKALEELRQNLMDLQAKHEEDVKKLTERCNDLQQQITDLKAVVDQHTEHLQQIDEAIKEIKKDIDEIQTKLTDIYNKINTINQQLSDLDVRITENKRLIDALNIQVNQNTLDIAELKKKTNQHDTMLEDHESRIKELERLIKEITDGESGTATDISDLQRRVSELEKKVEDHEERIKKLEEMLENLKIDVPVEIIDTAQMYNNVGPNWLVWFSSFWSNWDTAGWHYINKIAYDDPDLLAGGFIIGRVVANVVWCKLPLACWHELVIDSTDYATIYQKVKEFIEGQGLRNFIYPLYPKTGFFDITLSKPYPVQLDEFKFMGSYIPFINPDPETQKAYPVWKVSRHGEGDLVWELCQTWNTSVRLQFTAGSLNAKLCVITDCVYVGFQRNKVYLYSVCEVG